MPRRLHASLHVLRGRLRTEGLGGALRHIIRRSGAQFYERERHFVVCKDLDEIAVPARRESLVIKALDRSHLPALRELNRERDNLTGDARFAGDLQDGYGAIGAFQDGALVGFYWWADATMPPHRELSEVARGIRLGAGDVYGTDFYVSPGRRAQGTAAELLFLVETSFRDRGFERLWGTVADDNWRARWLYGARGYRELWAVEGIRLLRRWHYRTAPISA